MGEESLEEVSFRFSIFVDIMKTFLCLCGDTDSKRQKRLKSKMLLFLTLKIFGRTSMLFRLSRLQVKGAVAVERK
jgi:hypothetical protein